MIIYHEYMNRKAAADWLTARGLTIKATTLAKYATIGGGPRITRWGRLVRYAATDLETWAAGRLRVVASSSEAA